MPRIERHGRGALRRHPPASPGALRGVYGPCRGAWWCNKMLQGNVQSHRIASQAHLRGLRPPGGLQNATFCDILALQVLPSAPDPAPDVGAGLRITAAVMRNQLETKTYRNFTSDKIYYVNICALQQPNTLIPLGLRVDEPCRPVRCPSPTPLSTLDLADFDPFSTLSDPVTSPEVCPPPPHHPTPRGHRAHTHCSPLPYRAPKPNCVKLQYATLPLGVPGPPAGGPHILKEA